MSGPSHFATLTGNTIEVHVSGRGRNRFAQSIANDMTKAYESANLTQADHPKYTFEVTQVPSSDLRTEVERLTARDAATTQALKSLIADLEAHEAHEGEPVQARTATGWIDVVDRLRAALAS